MASDGKHNPGYTSFVKNPPLNALPDEIIPCLEAAAAGKPPPPGCDTIIGGIGRGGFCGEPAFQDTYYCACVNAYDLIPFPECIFAPCTDRGAYMTTKMYSVTRDAAKQCPQTINCNMISVMGGRQNVSSGNVQKINCGGTVIRGATAPLIVLAFLILLFAIVVSGGRRGAPKRVEGGGPPPVAEACCG